MEASTQANDNFFIRRGMFRLFIIIPSKAYIHVC